MQKTLDDERLRAEAKIAELTQQRNDLQKELTEKEFHIEQITLVFKTLKIAVHINCSTIDKKHHVFAVSRLRVMDVFV